MSDKLTDFFDLTVEAITNRLKADDCNAGDIKCAIDLLKNMKYEAQYVAGSQVEKVEDSLKEFPTFNQTA